MMGLPERCPRCEGDLEAGRVVGQGVYLNWIPEGERVGWITIGKEHVATGSLVRGPELSSMRCRGCGLGRFQT